MTENGKEPIDLLKRRVEKLLEKERRRGESEGAKHQLDWKGKSFAADVESVKLSEEVLKGVKTFVCTISQKVKEAESIDQVKRACFGLALLLLRDYDRTAFDRLLQMMRSDDEKR